MLKPLKCPKCKVELIKESTYPVPDLEKLYQKPIEVQIWKCPKCGHKLRVI